MELVRDGSLKNYRKKRQEKFVVTPSDLQGTRPLRKHSLSRSSLRDKLKTPSSPALRRAAESERDIEENLVNALTLRFDDSLVKISVGYVAKLIKVTNHMFSTIPIVLPPSSFFFGEGGSLRWETASLGWK